MIKPKTAVSRVARVFRKTTMKDVVIEMDQSKTDLQKHGIKTFKDMCNNMFDRNGLKGIYKSLEEYTPGRGYESVRGKIVTDGDLIMLSAGDSMEHRQFCNQLQNEALARVTVLQENS